MKCSGKIEESASNEPLNFGSKLLPCRRFALSECTLWAKICALRVLLVIIIFYLSIYLFYLILFYFIYLFLFFFWGGGLYQLFLTLLLFNYSNPPLVILAILPVFKAHDWFLSAPIGELLHFTLNIFVLVRVVRSIWFVLTINLESLNQSEPNFHPWLLSRQPRPSSKMGIASHM